MWKCNCSQIGQGEFYSLKKKQCYDHSKGKELTSVGRMKAGQAFLWMMVFEGANAAAWHFGREISVILFLYSLFSLMSNCLNLANGAQGRSQRLNEAYFLQIRNRGHRKDLYLGESRRVLFHFSSLETGSASCSVVSNSLWPHGLYCPWNSPGQNTGVGSFSLLQGIFLTQGLNTRL